MKFIWPVLLGIFRTAYAAYALWCLLFPVALLGLAWVFLVTCSDQLNLFKPWLWSGFGACILIALYAIGYTYWHRAAEDPNPWQSGFMAWFGTLKLFSNLGGAPAVRLFWPSSYLVENPHGYRISGVDLRAILNLLQPGDILLRGYEGYVDGEFIRRSSLTSENGFTAGWFTHVALYAGDLTEQDYAQVPQEFRDKPDYFSIGPQRVIHAMAKGVHTEDILTFLRCDYLTVLRLPTELSLQPNKATGISLACKQSSPPSPSDAMVSDILAALQAGSKLSRHQAVQAARQSALEKIGEAYDFDCSDTEKFDRFSCAELLYYCLRGVRGAIDLKPMAHAFYPLAPRFKQFRMLERVTITPDDYFDLTHHGQLHCVWEDSFSKTQP